MIIAKHLFIALAAVAVVVFVWLMSVDAYEFERTQSCDDCLILGEFYEWRSGE